MALNLEMDYSNYIKAARQNAANKKQSLVMPSASGTSPNKLGMAFDDTSVASSRPATGGKSNNQAGPSDAKLQASNQRIN